MRLSWSQISDAPDQPGVYAWYYRPEITDHDLNKFITDIENLKDNKREALKRVEDFFSKYIFSYFNEYDYNVIIKGSLKPSYVGQLKHAPESPQTLFERLVEDPSRLKKIKEILDECAPDFASPLYIGMSKSLRNRLLTHQTNIRKFNSNPNKNFVSLEGEESDNSFAYEVCKRKMITSRLFVICHPFNYDGENCKDIENILNRINYPLLGRN